MAGWHEHWNNFFNMTGAAGAQLIGLLFVTVTLVSGLSKSQSASGIRAFLTPTLWNFSAVLFQTLVLLVPWPSDRPIGSIFILGGLAGFVYRIKLIFLKNKIDFIKLQPLDRLPYDGIPIVGNVSLIAGGAGLLADSSFAPYAIAASSGLLLAAGIYGAWDLTLWMLKNRRDT